MSKEIIEEAEKETLQKIVLALPNDAQALRHIENYGNWRVKDLYSEEEVLSIFEEWKIFDENQDSFSGKDDLTFRQWFELKKKK